MTKQQAEITAQILRLRAYPEAVAMETYGGKWEVRAGGIVALEISELIEQVREHFENDPDLEKLCAELESHGDFLDNP